MSFTFRIEGHAGMGTQPTDEDEGVKVKKLQAAIRHLCGEHGLNVSIHEVSPPHWASPENASWN